MRNIALMLFPTIIITQILTVGCVLYQRPIPLETTESTHYKDTQESPPLFSEIAQIRDRKNSFFNFLRPLAESENKRILQQRQRLTKVQAKVSRHASLSSSDLHWVNQLAVTYKINKKAKANDTVDETLLRSLLSKVDQIPVSLVLAQGAIESAWGTSRFATQANNYFGQWCYTTHCGIVPRNRSQGKNHQVKKYGSVRNSVRDYIRNINSNAAYSELRNIRAQKRAQSKPLDGHDLAAGLKSYSAIGSEYIKIIRAIISSNQLENLNHCSTNGAHCNLAEASPN